MIVWHTPNGGRRDRIEAARLKALGVLRGIPDLLLLRDGHLYGLELKSEDGRPSPAQLATLDALQRAGATCAIAVGLLNALRQLEQWQLLRGASA
jgi:hypothetical protein